MKSSSLLGKVLSNKVLISSILQGLSNKCNYQWHLYLHMTVMWRPLLVHAYKSSEQNWKMEEENVTLHDQCFVYGGILTEIVYLTTSQSCAISSTLNAIYNTPSYSFYMWPL